MLQRPNDNTGVPGLQEAASTWLSISCEALFAALRRKPHIVLNSRGSIRKNGDKYINITPGELLQIIPALNNGDESTYSYDKNLGMLDALGIHLREDYLTKLTRADVVIYEACTFEALSAFVPNENKFYTTVDLALTEKAHAAIKNFKQNTLFPALKKIIEIHIAKNHPFPSLTRIGSKAGGANVGGTYTGLYQGLIDGEERLCLIKQDWDRSKLRVEKIISEALAGQMLSHIYPEIMRVSPNRFATVHLLHTIEQTTELNEINTYVQSVYIKGYIDDLWKYAYKAKYRTEYTGRLLSEPIVYDRAESEMLNQFYLSQINRYSNQLSETEDDELIMKLYTKKTYYEEGLRFLDQNSNLNDLLPALQHLDSQKKLSFVEDMVEAKIHDMERPSGAYVNIFSGANARYVVSQAILENRQLLEDFADLAVPRLLLGDFGLHNANFGVANIDGHHRLVSLDYGAAFLNLISELDPYDTHKTGITGFTERLYKNHFLEYDLRIICSENMANALIKLGNIPEQALLAYVMEAVDLVAAQFNVRALQEFCKRINMQPKDYEMTSDKAEIIYYIRKFIADRLIQRKQALKELGYDLLLEHCYNYQAKRVNRKKLAIIIHQNPGLLQHVLAGGFKRANLKLGSGVDAKTRITRAAVGMEYLEALLNRAFILGPDEKWRHIPTSRDITVYNQDVLSVVNRLPNDMEYLQRLYANVDKLREPVDKLYMLATTIQECNAAMIFCQFLRRPTSSETDISLIGLRISELENLKQDYANAIRTILNSYPGLMEQMTAKLSVVSGTTSENKEAQILEIIRRVGENSAIPATTISSIAAMAAAAASPATSPQLNLFRTSNINSLFSSSDSSQSASSRSQSPPNLKK